ncbi:uncharacterized protein (TIGR02284 family) [Luteibacter rhizovicinus]|uniref:Uncharacterized protein (TIGR02284 family) n=1 Tax=Luteibacter rhizovicinus TaxID=242606 RepID=A0A4R3YHG1_9GAMM|nr:PA2169 family four-helix-bundle protein [Luteibacter rhizovicinus]TCV92045.1 uncharacterized protein (TIGR02284 family) [Luteibacter rhizovicinus]
MERSSVRAFNSLIRRVIADRDLYRQAARGVREPGLRVILDESADALSTIAADLQGEVDSAGGRAARAAGVGVNGMRGTMMEASVRLSSDPDMSYVRSLEHMERRLLHAFVKLEGSSADRALVTRHIARLRLLHLDMTSMGRAAGP